MRYSINKLPRSVKEDLYNQHAMFVNPEETERKFYTRTLRVKFIDLTKIPENVLYKMSDDECNEYYKAMEKNPELRFSVITEGKLKDGLHRITALIRKGVTSMLAVDATGLLEVESSGYICDIDITREKPNNFRKSKESEFERSL